MVQRAKYLSPLLIANNFLPVLRRAYLNRFLKNKGDIKLISTSASPILGTPDSMTSSNQEIRSYIEKTYEHGVEQSNKHTH